MTNSNLELKEKVWEHPLRVAKYFITNFSNDTFKLQDTSLADKYKLQFPNYTW